tara:strand:+ start:477 stop:1067 length:591 start_codon:yes stop_codon:yes gene_type:complete
MSEIRVDTISEKTSANGVAIDSVTLKDGGATLADNITFSASGKGIHLGVTTATAANLLDDYEEGHYTVAFTCGSGSVGVNTSYDQAMYQKIGNRVFIQGYIEINSESSASGTLRVSIPFAVASGTERSARTGNYCLFGIGSNNASTESGNAVLSVEGDGSVARIVRHSGTNFSDDVGSDVDSSCFFYFNFNYSTDA